ncbi:MAG: phage tail protein [Cellvibrio sp.]|nr:phage tail protein [Cellvibrio sp.]
MPEYLAPGVFVEEVSYRAKSIEGVGTSVAGLVGPTRTGPLRGKPELLTSFADFVRIYGDANDLSLGGSSILNHTAIAAKAFFDGGGTKLFVSRVVGGTPVAASVSGGGGDVEFAARFAGAQGNYTLELHWRDSENLLNIEKPILPAENEVVFLEATGIPFAARHGDTDDAVVTDDHFPMGFRGLVRRSGDVYEIVDNLGTITVPLGQAALTPASLVAGGANGVFLRAALVNGGGVNVSFCV